MQPCPCVPSFQHITCTHTGPCTAQSHFTRLTRFRVSSQSHDAHRAEPSVKRSRLLELGVEPGQVVRSCRIAQYVETFPRGRGSNCKAQTPEPAGIPRAARIRGVSRELPSVGSRGCGASCRGPTRGGVPVPADDSHCVAGTARAREGQHRLAQRQRVPSPSNISRSITVEYRDHASVTF